MNRMFPGSAAIAAISRILRRADVGPLSQRSRIFSHRDFKDLDAEYGSNDARGSQAGYGILPYLAIIRHQRKLLDLRLRDQHAVERIPVQPWQRTILPRMFPLHRKFAEALRRECFLEVCRQVEFAEPLLDGDFPKTHGTDMDQVVRVGNGISRRSAETRIIAEPPQQRMRVEQEIHGFAFFLTVL